MRIRIFAATAILIALAACGSAARKGDAGSAAGVGKGAGAAAAAAEAVHFTPGEWESTIEMTGMNIPNLPSQYSRMNRGITSVHKSCLSPREAARPRGDLFAGRAGGECHYSDYSLAGGKLHAVMTCAGAGNTSTIVRTDGQYDAASFDVRSSVETKGTVASTMQMHVTARRVGDCAPGEAK